METRELNGTLVEEYCFTHEQFQQVLDCPNSGLDNQCKTSKIDCPFYLYCNSTRKKAKIVDLKEDGDFDYP